MSAEQLLAISETLSGQLDDLSWTTPTHVYNPLDYAWENHATYVRRYGQEPGRILMVGMNPGPWGMAQTGLPFGDVEKVSQWMGISGSLGANLPEQHPNYPIMGMACHRREGSGQRLWGWAEERFGAADDFFRQAFVWNYCPLLFIAQNRNLIPEKLSKAERQALTPICDQALEEVILALQPKLIVGIGRYAEQRVRAVMGDKFPLQYLLHPSPASPQANKNWDSHADELFEEHFI